MENLAPFRQGHSGIRWTLLPHQAALEWTSSTIAAAILKHKALWIVQGGEGGEQKQRWRNYTNRATKNLGFSTTQLQPKKAQRSLLRMIKQESHLTTNLPCFLFAPCTAHNSLCFKIASSSSKKLIEHTEKKTQ